MNPPTSTHRATRGNKSFFRLFLNLLISVINLLIPIFLATVVPVIWTACAIAIMLLTISLAAKIKWQKTAIQFSRWLTGIIIGLACHMVLVFPDYWNVAVFLIVLAAGLGLQASYERHLHLAPKSRSSMGQRSQAWPTDTPEGEPIRMLGGPGEIAMGGPAYGSFLFPDGVVLHGVGTGARFSNDGRYFVAQKPSRQCWGLIVLDRQTRRLYSGDDYEAFWAINELSDTPLRDGTKPINFNAPVSIELAEFLSSADTVELVHVHDLWIEPGPWQERIAVATREFPAPDGRLTLTACLHIPNTLQNLEDPLERLYYPRYTLQINGRDTALQIMNETPVIWRDDSQALACHANAIDDDPKKSGFWLWQSGQGWRLLSTPWEPGRSEPSLTWYDPCALDEHALRIEAKLDFPGLSCHSHGNQIYSIHSDMDVLIGHTPDGRMIVGECPRTSLRLSLPLDSKGARGTTGIDSALLACGLRARLQWLREGQNGLGAYRCQIGTWALPGEWLLDHRVSDDGRYLALITFADAPQAPGQLVIVDVKQRHLVAGPDLLFMRLQNFHAERVSLIDIVGRLKKETLRAAEFSTPLHRFQEPAPPPAQAAEFLAPRDDTDLYYQLRYATYTAQGLTLEPSWRIADQPQAANADGDFVLPAPDGIDAAWLFGAQTQYDDSSLRPDEARQAGYLLTASGCALSGLTPSMIWSQDSRYLALTRILPEREDNGHHQWQLLLLEPRTGRLQIRGKPLGCMPLFEQFDNTGLRLCVFNQSWHIRGDTGKSLLLSPDELAALPTTVMIQDSGLYMQADQQDDVNDWLALDAAPLAPWLRNS